MTFLPIPRESLSTMIGKRVHVKWAHHGCNWTLIRVDGDIAHLRTPKTRHDMTANVRDLCYTRKHEPIKSTPNKERAP